MVTVWRYVYSLRSVSDSLSRWATSFAKFAGGSWACAKAMRNTNVRMRPMAKSLGDFRAALLAGWVALGTAGILYARIKGIPNWAALPVLAAFLVTYPFYLVPAFPDLRERLARFPLLGYLTASAVLPYLMCCCGAVQFQWEGLARLVAVALAFGLWYVVLPAKPVVDIGFLAFIPAVLLGKYFNTIYIPLYAPLKDVIVLGHIALIEIVVMVLLQIGRA